MPGLWLALLSLCLPISLVICLHYYGCDSLAVRKLYCLVYCPCFDLPLEKLLFGDVLPRLAVVGDGGALGKRVVRPGRLHPCLTARVRGGGDMGDGVEDGPILLGLGGCGFMCCPCCDLGVVPRASRPPLGRHPVHEFDLLVVLDGVGVDRAGSLDDRGPAVALLPLGEDGRVGEVEPLAVLPRAPGRGVAEGGDDVVLDEGVHQAAVPGREVGMGAAHTATPRPRMGVPAGMVAGTTTELDVSVPR